MPAAEGGTSPKRASTAILSLAALGVVYGDIGTSPLYAIRESFRSLALTRDNILGILSIVFWALILVVSVKYLLFVLRADNRGEGGILALMALVHPEHRGVGVKLSRGKYVLVLLGIFGAALLIGDGMITPAISVLSAVEGIAVAAPSFSHFVLPVTVGILTAIFLVQRHGTARVGSLFGPVTLVWFATLAVLGVRGILLAPDVLTAVSPVHAARFFVENRLLGFLALGAVFLVVTGSEALYADMGHFGSRPIRLAWFTLVLPALLLNYFGQGALLLAHPEAISSPFYLLAPEWGLLPLVAISTAATIVASQAVISGAFSITMQAVHLGYLPRLRIEHTSATERGQIYLPAVNVVLAVATIWLVLEFKTSSALAAAYGVAVTSDMVITSLLFLAFVRESWLWAWWKVALFGLVFLTIDLAFWSAMVPKIPHGGWFPLVVALVGFTIMATWRRGRRLLGQRLREMQVPLTEFLEQARRNPPLRAPGTAVFLTGAPAATPLALRHLHKHTNVMHERILLLTIVPEEVARVRPAERLEYTELGDGFHRVVAHYGFMEEPSVPEIMELAGTRGFRVDPEQTTFFLGRERIVTAHGAKGMPLWRAKLFAAMAQNAEPVPKYFRIPPERVVEIGTQIRP
ncbi:MAG TPA: potassium transporter Kup [Candidatus Thermoplasmatota archaeon]|nr:potassium transporter Kup [Candidatus Thermoplasmatota archaeon]